MDRRRSFRPFSHPALPPPSASSRPALLLLFVLLGGCAPSIQLGSEVGPAEIPELETRVAEAPAAVPLLVRLGRAYQAAGRLEDGVEMLERAVALDSSHPAAIAHLGVAYEAAERPAEARQLYQRYEVTGDSEALLRWIQGRTPALRRQEMLVAAREAIRRESELGVSPSRPRYVAVFPFQYTGADPQYEPLGRALAEFLVTDLAQTGRITVLERMRVQLLLDEMELAAAGLVEPATAARSGRLLGAEHTVLGQLAASNDEVRLDAVVVRVETAAREGSPLEEQATLRQLFEAQKRLVLGVFGGLGIELTAAERERILEHRTQSLEALLAFGRGLAAEDRGDFRSAAGHYREAATRDPGFREAQARAEEAEVTAEAETGIPADVVAEVALDPAWDAGSLADLEMLIPDQLARDAVAEATGQEGLGRRVLLEVILRRP